MESFDKKWEAIVAGEPGRESEYVQAVELYKTSTEMLYSALQELSDDVNLGNYDNFAVYAEDPDSIPLPAELLEAVDIVTNMTVPYYESFESVEANDLRAIAQLIAEDEQRRYELINQSFGGGHDKEQWSSQDETLQFLQNSLEGDYYGDGTPLSEQVALIMKEDIAQFVAGFIRSKEETIS